MTARPCSGRPATGDSPPPSVQDIGKVLRGLVTEAHRKPRWLEPHEDPMADVKYRATARYQRQAPNYVPPSERPSTDEVERLCHALAERGTRVGRPWYEIMGRIAGYTGLRWGELIRLRPCDYDEHRRLLTVSRAIEEPDTGEPADAETKSGREREVPIPGSIHELLINHIDRVEKTPEGSEPWPIGGSKALLFPGPNGKPWLRSSWRRAAFIPAARLAGWEMIGDQPTPTGLTRGGHPRLPWRNLRHHAATWLHHVAGLPWEEVSHVLGHSNLAFTLTVYVRRGSDAEQELRRRLDPL